ncbi:MAG: methyltransferase domain-containing protein [Acetobacteraceae bacterium]
MRDVGHQDRERSADSRKRLADAPYDAIAAMEVIEHIVDPHDFLRAVRGNLSQSGIFILSTPNARYLDSCPDGDMLVPILSPGYHAVLYTAEGLMAILEKAGFRSVNVASAPGSLLAVASPSKMPLRADLDINRGKYVQYLKSPRSTDGIVLALGTWLSIATFSY